MLNTMHSFDSNSTSVPAFLLKLWKLVEDPLCDELIAWSDSGDSFIIKDQTKFAKDLLPQYFKHNNLASFIRQLNMYGFKKCTDFEKSGLRFENNDVKFAHGFFVRGRSELLEYIKRKNANNAKVVEPPAKSNAKDILVDLTSIREKQENMDNMLIKMKQENELLWRELTSMRQKHKAQEQIIQKVIQFLVSIVQRSGNQNIGVGVQRKIARMIHGSPSSKASTSSGSRTIDVLRKKNSDCIIVPEQMVSPLGPVIHEVTDCDHEEIQNSVPSFIVKSPESSVSSPQMKTSDKLVSILLPKSSGENESADSTKSKPTLVSILNSPAPASSPAEIGMLDGLTSKQPSMVSGGSHPESILGIPLEYITVPENDEVANVISIPEDGSVSNVVTVPEHEVLSNVISIPEGSSMSNIIPFSSPLANIISIAADGTVNRKQSSTSDTANSDIFNTSVVDGFGDLSNRDLLAYSSSLTKSDMDNDMSESLQTPKIFSSDDDCGFSVRNTKDNAPSKNDLEKYSGNKNNTYNEHDYLATNSSIVKNVLSNHLLSVDEKLNFAQDHLASNLTNMDIHSLLGLFSNDDVLNYESFTNNIGEDLHLKSGNEIVGNEIVQFNPSGLDADMDITNTPLFECLTQNDDEPNSVFNYQSDGTILEDVLNESAASEIAEYLNKTSENDVSSKRQKTTKTARAKRRKLK